MTTVTFPRLRDRALLTALGESARRAWTRYRLTPEERRNLAKCRAEYAAVFTASIGGHPYYR
ncbi:MULTISPECIES: hypothetical protein [unclassified Nocardia]|uniref:hypothetical protein n=1 Tax=unclassified Nocardia TaxID=2637762 RepID=UPI001CE46C1D|nr:MULTISPECIES: hypothetical protein [unclassified Nocardia]